jgi:two-component system chemotaxis sensor kinase CheA
LGAVFLGLMLMGMRLAGLYGALERRLRQRSQALEDARKALGVVQHQKNALWEGAQQAFFWMNHQGELVRDPSPCAVHWWGQPAAESTALDWLGRVDASFARRLEDAIQTWPEEGNPLEHLPMALHSRQRDWSLAYSHVIEEGEGLILVSALEVTEARRCRVLEERHLRQETALRSLSQDRATVVAFYQAAGELVEALSGTKMTDALSQRQQLYALEGEATFAGVDHLARLCKQMSRALYTEDRVLLRSERLALQEAWQQWEALARPSLSPAERWLEVPRDQAQALLEGLGSPEGVREAARALQRWTRTPAQEPLDRLAARVRHIAAERGMRIRVLVEAGADLYLETQRWAPFWGAALHVAHNCLDHGLETVQERLTLGKPAEGRLTLSMQAVQGRLILRIADDGRGVDWRRVAELARIAGLPHGDRETLVEALFHNGLSTGNGEGYCAGLGLGLGSAREVAADLGGALSVQSASGAGTDVLFSFPLSMALLPELPEVVARPERSERARPRATEPAPIRLSPALEQSLKITGDMAALRKSLDED